MKIIRFVTFASLLALAACGAPQMQEVTPPAGTFKPAAGAEAQGRPAPDLIVAINAAREAEGLGVLAVSPAANRAAREQAGDMATVGFMDHTGSDGSTPGDRLTAAGLDWCIVAENVAYGHPTAEAVVEGWLRSAGHRHNLLSDTTLVGAATAGPEERPYWSAVFAQPC
ncbi:CAP domain-containing protein [Pseudooceanicola spongiae]|uniref:SCP domain-containing protein n=1 Tax=Pseudooceanicola spongiae TaxID=2613965 RepID=A0A7L9WR60_9RHOB|nr:CAP domain-containing protein [Pseudooceanicola spongiae]QOL81570.1 hypothetical protein F3W81_12490 [Pseudooceanicola spongiae]